MPKLFSVKTLQAVVPDEDLDISTYPTRFVEFWRMRDKQANPKDRVNPSREARKILKESIKKHGITQPLVLTSDLVRLDGHVRSSIGSELGMVGATCHIAPFDSKDPRAELLYGILNTRVAMTSAQRTEAAFGGALPEDKAAQKIKKDAIKWFGAEGFHLELFKTNGYSPQLLSNCRQVSNLVFGNSLLDNRKDREAFVYRTVLKWQCVGNRQRSIIEYCARMRKGFAGYTAKRLWAAIKDGEDLNG